MLIQNQNRFPTALLTVRRIPKIHIHTHIRVHVYVHTMTTAVRERMKNDGRRGVQSILSIYA